MEFKDIFKTLRIQDGLTQREIAEELNIPQSTIAKYEKGQLEANYNTLIKIADFFNVRVDELLGREELVYVPIAARTGNRGGTYISKEDADAIRKELEEYED